MSPEDSMALASRLTLLVAALLATPALAGTVVPVGPFNRIALNGGGEVILKHGATQRVTLIKGSTAHTSFTMRNDGELDIDACNVSCPHQYDLTIEIVTPNLRGAAIDRKSTRLNSSHMSISYAVFCLKKKNKKQI